MASTTPSSRPANPTSPSYSDDLEFVTAYLTVRALSDASRVYAYVLWIALGAFLFFWSICHHLQIRGGYLGALWSKWALRRRTWRKKHTLALAKANGQPHRQPYSFPANAQLFTVVLIFIVALAVSFLGPDNLAPGSYFWTLSKYPYATTSGLAKREYTMDQFMQFQPQYTIPKAWWTMGDRTGLIAFALFPLCVLFAMKSPPFAILSLSFTVQVFCDKLMLLHKATAWLIYLLTVLHVAFWSVQLTMDHRNGKVAYTFAWQYEKFLFAWIAFGCMTLVFLLSIAPMRKKHYEAFWFLHVLFVPLTIVMSALHHPPVWWWCWAALALWIGERSWRCTWWLYINGFVGGKSSAPSNKLRNAGLHDKKLGHPQPLRTKGVSPYPATPLSTSSLGIGHYPPHVQLPGIGVSLPTDYVPPPGFVHAELLPGRTVRLRIVTPGYLTWAPGQHFLISIPAITRFTTHPFTTASICDEQNQYDDGRVLVFLIRAKGGWTKDLWDTIAMMHARGQQFLREEKPPPCEMPSRGVLLRACVDGPFGSSARASWGDYSSVLIVTGGSGVSYGLSVLQYVCLCMAGRDGRFLGGRSGGYGQRGYKTNRVRFVWLVREFGHIQWCAPILRKCMDIVGPSELQIDIFVTNVRPEAGPSPASPSRVSFAHLPRMAELEPPRPGFTRPESRASFSSEESGEDSDLDLSYYTDMVQDQGELGHEEHVLDLTNWEGDDDTGLPGEAQFHLSIKKEGRWRRVFSRRGSSGAPRVKDNPSQGVSQSDLEGPSQSTVQLVKKQDPIQPPPIITNLPPPMRPTVHGAGGSWSSIDTATLRQSQSTEGRPDSYANLKTPNSAVPLLDATHSPLSPMPPVGSLSGSGSSVGRKRFSQLSQISEQSSAFHTPRSLSRLSQWTDTGTFAALVPRGEVESVREELLLNLDEREAEDVGIVAEHARPGKPKFDRVLADEVERAKGAIAVACCGPTSLDAVMRKVVAAQIDPQKVRRGDMRGSIALFSEEFSY